MGSVRPRMNRSVAALLICQFCSAAAALAQATVLGKVVYDLTSSKLDLGLLGLAEFAPSFVLVLATGTVADRLERRRVASVAMFGEAVAAAALGWYVASGPTSVGPIFALVIGFGTARAFGAPATRSLPADMVAPEDLPWLVARNSVAWQAALIFGPVLGGLLLAADVRLPFVAVTVLLLVGAVAALSVQVKAGPRVEVVVDAAEPVPVTRGRLREAMEGLHFLKGQPILLGAISLDLFAVLFGGAVALLPAIAKDRLGVGAVGLGWLRAAGGIGAAMTTLVLTVRPVTRRVGRTLLVAVALFGTWTIVLGVTKVYVLAFLAMVFLSAADAVSVFIRATLVPLVTPDDKRGRVLAVEAVFIGASNELGAFESGVTGQLIGTSGSVILGGAATLAIAVSWWAVFPSLRGVDAFPQPEPQP